MSNCFFYFEGIWKNSFFNFLPYNTTHNTKMYFKSTANYLIVHFAMMTLSHTWMRQMATMMTCGIMMSQGSLTQALLIPKVILVACVPTQKSSVQDRMQWMQIAIERSGGLGQSWEESRYREFRTPYQYPLLVPPLWTPHRNDQMLPNFTKFDQILPNLTNLFNQI